MRRNNDWLAVLAVSLVLSILRNSLAGERYPLDYDNAELPVNRSKTAYETYNPNELTSPRSRSRTNPSTSSRIAESRSSSSSLSFVAPQSTQSRSHASDVKNVVPSKDRSGNRTNVITQRRATKLDKLEDEEQSNTGRSILHESNERSGERRTGNSGVQVAEGSRGFDLGIPQQSRLSSWMPRAPINDVSRWINHAKPAAKPSKIGGRETSETSEKASEQGSELPHYRHGHARRIGGDEGGEPSTRDLSQTERFLHLERADSSGNSKKIVRKRFLTGYSVLSVSLNRRLNKLERLSKLVVARRSKNRRGRSVGYLRRDSWPLFGNGDRQNDRFETESIDAPHRIELDEIASRQSTTTRHDDPRDKGNFDSASIRGKRDSLSAFDSSNVTFRHEGTTKSFPVNATNNRESVKESSFHPIEDNLADRLTIPAGNENYSNASSAHIRPNVSEASVLSARYENDSDADSRWTFELQWRAGDDQRSVMNDIETNEPANRATVINSQSNGNARDLHPRDSNDESALTSTDTGNDLIDGTELDGEEGAVKERRNEEDEERSALTSVPVNSRRGSAAARRNATHLRRSDMNSLAAAGSFVLGESSALSPRHRARNANDSFRNSSTTGHEGEEVSRIVENFNVNSLAERSSVNNEEQAGSRVSPTVPPNVLSKNAVLEEEVAATSSGRDDESLWASSEIDDQATPVRDSRESSAIDQIEVTINDRGTLNGPPRIGLEEGNSVDSANRKLAVGEIKANESAFFPASGSSSNVEGSKKTMVDLEDRLTNASRRSPDDRDSKERKSRSSKASAPKASIEDTATSNKDETRRNVRNVSIDYTTPKVNDDIPIEATRAKSNGSFQFLSNGPPILSTTILATSTTKQPTDDPLATSDATFSSTGGDQLQTVSTVQSLINDEDQLLGFVVTSTLEPVDDEDLYTTVSNVSLRETDNSSREMEQPDQWPVKHSAVVEGDLVLGGLMMVHEREDTITCGPVMSQGGIQALEAMLYTLDRLNDVKIIPGVKIGAHILDDCDKDTYGLEMAVDFIKGSISNIDGAEYSCNKTAVRKVISGVVGAASSVTSIQVANLLRLFRIPQVSFFSTSPELSNKQRFEYFTRTIPSDHYQVKAMVDIVLDIGWSYVSIIYEESNYGIKAFEELEELLGKNNICIAIKEKLVKDSGVAEETAYDNIVLKLLTKPRARGCIIFGSDQEVAGVMRAVRRCNATGAFSWIGSDGWSARGLVSNGNEPEVEGTLSVQPQANPVNGFEEYFLNLTVENNRRNPWFVEFWEDHFQCRYPNASVTPYNQKYKKPCTTKERLTKQNTVFEDQLQFVSDAVMAFGYAFRDMHRDLCDGKPGLCETMKPNKGTELLKYLRKVNFKGLSGDQFEFDQNGDGPARYNIIHFKQIEPGRYKWVRVGEYVNGELNWNKTEIQFKLGHPQPPESVCSLPCEVGQAKKYVEGEKCCWHCFNCTQYQIRHPRDETQCTPCRQGTVPDDTHSACRDIPEEFLRPESGWAIGAMAFSATGILITLFVCGVFLKHNDTPVVRASGRELSYVLLSGILLCYLVTFALVLRPTDVVCGIQRFTAGFCFTVVYAALLTKTNRISRIFNASKHSAKRPSFISPRSQLIICFGLVFVQILINGLWMIIDPAKAMHHYPTREDNLLVCNSYVDASYMIAFAYPIMLIVVCTVYAVLTRKIPEAFNESKHIGFTMYTTCVIWLAFVPLYFGTGNNVALRITSMSVTISLSASVTIVCLFSPKLYIILIRPERNVRQSMMPTKYSTTKSSAVTATNASSMIAPVTLTAATCDQNKAVKKHIATTIDCSTQSEYYELEIKDQKNGKPPASVVSRSTQTTANNDKDSSTMISSKDSKENTTTTTKQLNNNARIGNGPVNQSEVPL